jgi:sphingolipid delta-4 desaturase
LRDGAFACAPSSAVDAPRKNAAVFAQRPLAEPDNRRMEEGLPYQWTEAPEPHFLRRREILAKHPEIKALMGYDLWPNLRMACVVALQFGIAWLLQRGRADGSWLGSGWTMFLASYFIGSIAAHYGGVFWHEASHNLCAPTPFWNRVVAIFSNVVVVVPSAMSFRRHHMTHHTYMGIVGRDNDLPSKREADWVGHSWWRKIVWLMFYTVFAVFNRGFWHKPDRWEIAGIVVQMAVNVLSVVYLGWWAFLYLALSTWFASGPHPVAGHFIHEHYLWDPAQETYSYYGLLNKVTLNMGYHNEHHDFMNVPGSQLPKLHAIAKDYYAPLTSHRSWTLIFVRFIFDGTLSHWSRFTRSFLVLQKARDAVIQRRRGELRGAA